MYCALLELSKDNSRPLLWVDAVCINQADTNERNAQVAIMKYIYSNATQVVIWLGEENRRTSGRIYKASSIITEGKSILSKPLLSPDEEAFISNFLTCKELEEWFHRCWTLQELLLAKTAMVRCGPYVIAWERLFMLMDMGWYTYTYSGAGVRHKDDGRARARARCVMRLQDLTAKFRTDQLTLTQVLMESSRRHRSESVDMFFSVMGLFPEPPVAIDYSEDLEKVCKAATLACIVRERKLDIFELVAHPDLRYSNFFRLLGEYEPGYPWNTSWAVKLPHVWDVERLESIKLDEATSLLPPEDVQDELIAQIISEPDIAVLPLTRHILGRFVTSEDGDVASWLAAVPSCAVKATTISRSATETTVPLAGEASDTFGPLLQLLENHDERFCECSEAPSRSPGTYYHDLANNRDWLCCIKGGRSLYLLRPARTGHLQLITLIRSRSVEHLFSAFPSGKMKNLESLHQNTISRFTACGWPTLEVDLPLA